MVFLIQLILEKYLKYNKKRKYKLIVSKINMFKDKEELSNAADYHKNGQMGDKEFERMKQKYIQTISIIHKTFIRSEDFQRTLTKEQRKDYKNLCDFKQKLKTNIFLQYYIKDDTTYCKCKVNSASILGYKETPYDPHGTGDEDTPNNG